VTHIVETVAEGEALSRPPLVIVGRGRAFLDAHGEGFQNAVR
jgi:hypothetical protein